MGRERVAIDQCAAMSPLTLRIEGRTSGLQWAQPAMKSGRREIGR